MEQQKPKWKMWQKIVLGSIFGLLLIVFVLVQLLVSKAEKQEQSKLTGSKKEANLKEPITNVDTAAKNELLTGIDTNAQRKELNTLLINFIKIEDEFEKVTWYVHKTFGKNWPSRSTIRPLVRQDGYQYYESNYHATDWIFHNKVTVLVNGSTISSPDVEQGNQKTENTINGVWEVNQYQSMTGLLAAISGAKNQQVKVRFHGQQFVKDIILNKADKEAISQTWNLATLLTFFHNLKK